MITFEFELLEDDAYGLGHVSVLSDGEVKATSKGRVPNQSMMLFLSIAGLLDTIGRLREVPSMKAATFTAIDGSFSLRFERRRTRKDGERIAIVHRSSEVALVTTEQLVTAIGGPVEQLATVHWRSIASDPSVLESVSTAMTSFGLELPRSKG